MNRQILGIAIPILTFLLGCAFTLYMKRVDERRQAGRTSAGELWKLVKEWYEQLRQLQIDLLNSPNLRHVHERLGTYLGNRLILPGVLYHLEILKKQKQHRELVAEVEQFLQMVTDYDPVDVYRQTNCRLLMELLDFLPGDAEGAPG